MSDAAATSTELSHPPLCRNCDTPAPGNYCPECGQETSLHPPSVREFANHFLGNYVAVKSTLAQTLWALVSKPGQLTVDYLAGRKRRYVLPLKLYLTVSIVSLLLISLFAGLGMQAPPLKLDRERDMNATIIDINGVSIKYEKGKFMCAGLPDRACNHLRKRFDHSPDELKAVFEDTPQRMLKFWGYAMFVLIPLFALMLKLLYRSRRMVYGEHLVFALHLHAFWMLAVMLMAVLPDGTPAFVNTVLFLSMPVYAWLALRRVYGGRWFPRLLRVSLLATVNWCFMMVMLVLVTLLAIIF